MGLRILDAPSDPSELERRLRAAIEGALAGARARVQATGPGHFEIEVVWPGFGGLSRLKQHQSVYKAIEPLMRGDAAPVHAIDRLDCRDA
jgi:stress-induced morphogen